jgi:hypothetical protein
MNESLLLDPNAHGKTVQVCLLKKHLPVSCTRLPGNTRQSLFNQPDYRWTDQTRSDFQRA